MKHLIIPCMSIQLILVLFHLSVRAQYNNSIYDKFLISQGKFPKPQLYDTIFVGTYDALSGKFEGIKSLQSPGSKLPLGFTNIGSQAKKHRLLFEVKNFTGNFSVTVNNRESYNSASSNKIYVDEVGHGNIQWSIKVGNREHTDRFKIVKYPFVAAGVFKIPYLLVAIVYEPPPGPNNNNNATYSIKESFSAITNFKFSIDRNETRALPSSIEEFKSKINSLSSLLSSSGETKTAGNVLKTLAEALGGYKAEEVKGNVKENELVFEFASSSGYQVSTNTPNRGGPGKGDVYFCLKGCSFLWFVHDESIYTTFLSTDGFFTPTADELRTYIDNAESELEKNSYNELALQNPYFSNPRTSGLPAKRFGVPKDLECTGNFIGFRNEDINFSSSNAVTTYSTLTEDYVEGWLSYLGLPAVDESKKVKTTITNRISKQMLTQARIENSYFINDVCGIYWYYLDKTYGTFVVTDIAPPDHSITYSGTYRDNNGLPVPNTKFKILHKGKSYVAITNQKGEFKFYHPELLNYRPKKMPVYQSSTYILNKKNNKK